MGGRTPSWSIPPRPPGIRPPSPSASPASLGRTSGSCISCATRACERFGRLYPDRYLRVRYEDLARAPAETMRRLFAEILPGSEWRPGDIGGSGNRHQLYGNRMRSASLSLAEVKEDTGWTRDMPPAYRSLVAAHT